MHHQSDEARICEMVDLFVQEGWRLRVEQEDDGSWTAAFSPGPIAGAPVSAVIAHEVSGTTAVAAAEAAWAKYEREPSLGGGSTVEE